MALDKNTGITAVLPMLMMANSDAEDFWYIGAALI